MNNLRYATAICFFLLPLSCKPLQKIESKSEDWQSNEKIFLMPPELLKQNVRETNYTAIVFLTSSEIVVDNKKIPGGVRHVYSADVKETIKGPAYHKIIFSVWAEVGLSPHLSKHPVVVSLCKGENNSLWVPDNGYVADVTEELAKYARSLKDMGELFDPKNESVCSTEDR